MLITVLFCSTLGLAYAVDDGYIYPKPSFQITDMFPQPQCPAGSGQYPNCAPSILPPIPSPLSQCPSGSIGQFPYCQIIPPPQKAYLPQIPQNCPSGSFGQFPKCQVIPPPTSQCAGQSPNCVPPPYSSLPPQQCPSGSFGQFPNCRVIPPQVPPQQCPSGNFGQYPNCHAIPQPSNLPASPVTPTTQCTGPDCGGGGDEEGFGGPKTDSEVSFKLLQSSVG